MVNFDGTNKLIIVDTGITELSVKTVYSLWKEWLLIGDNSKYEQAFRVVGGDPISATLNVGEYYFMTNDWKIRPFEGTHTLNVDGNIFVDGGVGSPFVPPLGTYTVLINTLLSSNSTLVNGGAAGGLTPSQATQLFEIFTILGLNNLAPLNVSPTNRNAGSINQDIDKSGDTVTVSRL